jgi:hypothetical protein
VRIDTRVAFVILALSFTGTASSQSQPPLQNVLSLARQEVETLSKVAGLLVADEECEQRAFESNGEATGTNSFGNAANIGSGNPVRVDPRGKRRWRATVTLGATPGLARTTGRAWVEIREIIETDGRRLSPPDDRASALFAHPDWSQEEAYRLSAENGRFNMGPIGRLAATPWLPLLILHPVNERRFSFEKAGEEPVQRTPTWKVAFRERTAPTLLSAGQNGCGATGTLWIQPTTGRVLRVFLQCIDLGRPDSVSVLTVNYHRDSSLALDVPFEMTEQPESDSGKEWSGRRGKMWVESKCGYSRFRRGPNGQ